MPPTPPRRLPWPLWLAAVSLWLAIWLYPISDNKTRIAGLILLPIIWLTLILLLWRNRLPRIALVVLTLLITAFLILPSHPPWAGVAEGEAPRLQIGDLAVTTSGAHILAYLGNNTWIEADPNIGKVITTHPNTKDSMWLTSPMNIVRWNILQNESTPQ